MAATFLSDNFKEHIGVIKALHANYQARDDFELVGEAENIFSEVQRICSTREADVSQLVKGASLCRVTGRTATPAWGDQT